MVLLPFRRLPTALIKSFAYKVTTKVNEFMHVVKLLFHFYWNILGRIYNLALIIINI